MEEHLDEFVAETEDELVKLGNSLVDLENSSGDEEALDEVFRTAHTLKGTYAAMGFGEPHDVAHAMEDVLDEIRAGELEVTPELVDVLFDGVNALEDSLVDIEDSGEVKESYDSVVEKIESETEGYQQQREPGESGDNVGEEDSYGEDTDQPEATVEEDDDDGVGEIDEISEEAGEEVTEEADEEVTEEAGEEGTEEVGDTGEGESIDVEDAGNLEVGDELDVDEHEEAAEAEDIDVEQAAGEREKDDEGGARDFDTNAVVAWFSDETLPDSDPASLVDELEDRDDVQILETKPERARLEAGDYEDSFRVVAETESHVDLEEHELDRADSVTVIEDDVGLLDRGTSSEERRGYVSRILDLFDVRKYFGSEETTDEKPRDGTTDESHGSQEPDADVDEPEGEGDVSLDGQEKQSSTETLAVINVETADDGETPEHLIEDIERSTGVDVEQVPGVEDGEDDGSTKLVARLDGDVDAEEIELDYDASITLVEDDIGIVNDSLNSEEMKSESMEDAAGEAGPSSEDEETGFGDSPVLEITVSEDGFPAAAAVAVLEDIESIEGLEIRSTLPEREALEEGEYDDSFQVALESGDPAAVEPSKLRKVESVEVTNDQTEKEPEAGDAGDPEEVEGSTTTASADDEDGSSSDDDGFDAGDDTGGSDEPGGSLESSGEDEAIKSVRVDVDQLDEMMSNVNELVITKIQLQHAVERRDYEQLRKRADKLDKLSEKMRDDIMDARLVPLKKITGKYPRIVRDVARKEGKEVDFDVEGEDIELDRSILENLKEPIVHLLKNSVDHGIEAPEDRVEAGKPRKGNVVLEAERYQDRVEIQIRDDGAGLEADEIRAKAVERGVVSAQEAERMPDDEVYELVLESGFSTKEEVTDTSGRGVGLNAVQEAIRENEGSIGISSEPGEGTVVTLTLPIDITVVDAMLIGVDGRKYAVPMKAVSAVSSREDADIDRIQGEEVCVVGDDPRPLIDLPRSFAPDGGADDGEAGGMILHFRDEVREASIECSEVYGQQEIVVQPFEGALAEVDTFSGTAILGKGEVVPVLEVNEL